MQLKCPELEVVEVHGFFLLEHEAYLLVFAAGTPALA